MMARLAAIIGFMVLFFLICPRSVMGSPTRVRVVHPDEIRLLLAYHPKGLTVAETKAQYPQALAILTGHYFHKKTLAVGGLFIRQGRAQAEPRGLSHRSALGWTADGKIMIGTAQAVWLQRRRLFGALEAGPFLIYRGRAWNEWGIEDPSFYRPTLRQAVGLTKSGQFIWATGIGDLSEFRTGVSNQLKGKIKYLMLLDGGSSAAPNKRLPTRLVIVPRPPAIGRWIEWAFYSSR